ncbi:hypothetical protein MRB53_013616 [Persea americana]|uniref:Uncharacterized protein n=1 Tax=Persea americana TaxID=3435 RepID=A0ACC2K8J2_PERAE|nr:hypothetical protein MRB53_013616 [Persea americana]
MAQSLELLLIQFFMPDYDARRQAEEQIKRLSNDPRPPPPYHQDPQRQAALRCPPREDHRPQGQALPHLRQSVKSALIDGITVEHRYPTAEVKITGERRRCPVWAWFHLLQQRRRTGGSWFPVCSVDIRPRRSSPSITKIAPPEPEKKHRLLKDCAIAAEEEGRSRLQNQ